MKRDVDIEECLLKFSEFKILCSEFDSQIIHFNKNKINKEFGILFSRIEHHSHEANNYECNGKDFYIFEITDHKKLSLFSLKYNLFGNINNKTCLSKKLIKD